MCGVEGNRMQDLHIEVRDQDIVVTMPGTSLRVVYRKPHRGSQLVARLDYFQESAPQVSDSEGASGHTLSTERAPYGTSRTQPQDASATVPEDAHHPRSCSCFLGEHLRWC